MARGRKTLFKQYMVNERYRLGALGLTLTEMAKIWNVTERSLYRWANRHREFSQAINRGKEEADTTAVNALLKEAREGNITGIIFWLKNRQPAKWRDKAEGLNVSVSAQANAEASSNVADKSIEELERDFDEAAILIEAWRNSRQRAVSE